MRVEIAKEEIRKELLSKGQADSMWEPSGEVVCRCTTRAIVKVVDDQWFLSYADPAWKAKVHEAIASMDLHPEALRKWLDYVTDWLHDWPCTHHRGLGTILPWDPDWVIESLSDSTIYMAYYTIAHALQGGALRSPVPWAGRLDDAFFEHVFFGKGEARTIASRLAVDVKLIEELRREFTYWYPIDLRNTAKDLVQNHMAFCLFHHVALFPKEQWPRGYGVNGYVQLAGRKMSKSRGNVWYIRDALRQWPADVIRLTVANAGDGLDDPNVDMDFADVAEARLQEWVRFATTKHSTRRDKHGIDAWFLSVLSRSVQATRTAMEDMNYKAALRHGYFDLQSAWSWYLRRSENRPQADCVRRFIEVQTKMLAPFTPHIAEEIWHQLGGSGFVVGSVYPEAKEGEIDPRAETAETLLQSTLADIREILKVTRISPKRLALYIAPAWKVSVHEIARGLAAQGALSINILMEKALARPGMRERAKDVAEYAKQVAEELRHARVEDLERFGSVDEFAMFLENSHFLGKELGVKVGVFRADDSERWDPAKKAERAVPGRPAIYVE
jgi:leucyl-tRNA synthetase